MKRKSRVVTWDMPSGENHKAWKGVNASYSSKHKYMYLHYGKANHCEHCGDTSERRYNWANKSGNYLRERHDWISLCVPCHRKYDGLTNRIIFQEFCRNGHRLTLDNLMLIRREPPSNNNISCRECGRESTRRRRAKNKANAEPVNT